MTIIKTEELVKKVLDDYNAAMKEQDRIKQGSTVIDVVVRHEKEIQELKRLITPTGQLGPLDAAREWLGLTNEEIGGLTVFDGLHHVSTPLLAEFIKSIEAKLKEKNT